MFSSPEYTLYFYFILFFVNLVFVIILLNFFGKLKQISTVSSLLPISILFLTLSSWMFYTYNTWLVFHFFLDIFAQCQFERCLIL